MTRHDPPVYVKELVASSLAAKTTSLAETPARTANSPTRRRICARSLASSTTTSIVTGHPYRPKGFVTLAGSGQVMTLSKRPVPAHLAPETTTCRVARSPAGAPARATSRTSSATPPTHEVAKAAAKPGTPAGVAFAPEWAPGQHATPSGKSAPVAPGRLAHLPLGGPMKQLLNVHD
jgi:hypothetical protein